MAGETEVMDGQALGARVEAGAADGSVTVVFQRELPVFVTDPLLTLNGLGNVGR